MQQNIVVIVAAPDIELTEDMAAGDVLVTFYRALGWNGLDYVDPCKVRTTKAVYNRLHEMMTERCPDLVATGMAMVSKGPGVDDDVPQGKVKLLEGWIIPTDTVTERTDE